LKLDAVTEELYQMINAPVQDVKVAQIMEWLKLFNGQFVLQTLFFSGKIGGVEFDNAKEPHLSQWIDVVLMLKPRKVMLYSLDRETPAENLTKISTKEMEKIAQVIRDKGIPTSVY